MATHSSILAWRIPWTKEPGGPQSMGLQRVRHDIATEQQQNTLSRTLIYNHYLFHESYFHKEKFFSIMWN